MTRCPWCRYYHDSRQVRLCKDCLKYLGARMKKQGFKKNVPHRNAQYRPSFFARSSRHRRNKKDADKD